MSNDASPPAQPRRLTTFVPPRPSPRLMRALVLVNRVLCLGGIPGLRRVPVLNRVPGVRGLTDIVAIDFPARDERRLKETIGPGKATFITPNHPEFFTDWMLDKEVLARVAPLAASWATHMVVNGLGRAAQSFWLKNNLIAQIPGAAGAGGRAHSIAWALDGHGVLLHPEGVVGWHGDWIAPLFPGAIEMAAEAVIAARRQGRPAQGLVAPVVWKLKFVRSEEHRLAAEMAYVERRLKLAAPLPSAGLTDRIAAAYRALLQRDADRCGIPVVGDGLAQGHRRIEAAVRERVAQHLGRDDAGDGHDARTLLLKAERWLRTAEPGGGAELAEAKAVVALLRRLHRISPQLYPGPTVTQEQVAETIKRLRNDYCQGSLRDTMNAYLPRPAGARRALIRVPEPIDVAAVLGARDGLADGEAAQLAEDLRRRMQASLDAINAEIESGGGVIRYPNPLRD